MDKIPLGVKPLNEGRAILSPNPTANSASVAEEEDGACETSQIKSPQGYYLLASEGFFVLRDFNMSTIYVPVKTLSPSNKILLV